MKNLLTFCVILIAGLLINTTAQTMINNFDNSAANLSTNVESPSTINIADNNTDFVQGTGSLDVDATIANVHSWGTFAMISQDITQDWTSSKDDTLHLWIKVREAPKNPQYIFFRIQLWDQPTSTDNREAYIFEDSLALDKVTDWFEEKIPFNERATDGSTPPNNEGFVLAPANWGMGGNNGKLDFDKIVGYDIVAVTSIGIADSLKFSYDSFTRGPVTPLPVELTSFRALAGKNQVKLNWSTATEKNNKGFEVERKQTNGSFEKIGFVEGSGTSTKMNSYSFIDSKLNSGSYTYRLKQIDLNGKYQYSKEVNVKVSSPFTFSLEQNYPNPFNPATTISYQIPISGNVTLKIYNALGVEVAVLVNGMKKAGSYKIHFNAKNLSSGIYYYKLNVGNFVSTKKMMLMK